MRDWAAIRQEFLAKSAQEFVPESLKLPVFPRAVSEFIRLANNPRSDIKDLARPLNTDTNLTCELLKHVNSSATGRRFKASSVSQAISSLGVRRSKLFLMAAAVQHMTYNFQCRFVDLNTFWNANLERAVFARLTAKRLGADEDVAYTAAMLQDFILPIMSQTKLEWYTQFLSDRAQNNGDLVQFERSRIGCDHAMVAATCMLKWGFPDDLTCAVLLHHCGDDQLEEYGLMRTAVAAVSASAMLPDPFEQQPLGIARLFEREANDPSFDLFEIAEQVDDEISELSRDAGNRIPLMDRVEAYAQRHLESSMRPDATTQHTVGSYTLEEKLGEGSMGTVYKARHAMLKRPAAVKLLHADLFDEKSVSLFEREVQLTSQLSHPCTVSIYDYGRTPDGTFYYVMEYVDGLNLKQVIQTHGPMPPARAIHLLLQLCGSLAEAHECGLIHRDIKPENLSISRKVGQSDSLTVLDFGLVTPVGGQSGQKKNAIMGTPLYLAPEAIDNPDEIDQRSDLYSTGAVAYYLLTGQTIFTGNDVIDICMQQLKAQPVSPSKRLGRPISEDLEEVVMACLHKDRNQRPNSVLDLISRLQACVDHGSWAEQDARAWWDQHAATGQQMRFGGHDESSSDQNSCTATLLFDGEFAIAGR